MEVPKQFHPPFEHQMASRPAYLGEQPLFMWTTLKVENSIGEQ